MSLCFNSLQRLKKPSQFQCVYNSKQWGGSKHFSFNALGRSVLDDNSKQAAVFGFTVSKKVSKRAVDRNKIKRQMREFVRLRQHDLYDATIVITAKPSCINASDKERIDSLLELWKKVLGWRRWHQRQLLKASHAE